jgi:signal peptidase I
MAQLFACSFIPFYSPEALKFTVGFFEQVARTVPCYKLSFIPDKRAVGFIQQLRDTTPQASLFNHKPSLQFLAVIPQQLFIEVSTELLRQGQRVRFKAPGRSMNPTIKEGETIIIQPAAPSSVRKGDIILYRFERGFIAHRVVRILRKKSDTPSFIMQGDASDAFDCPVSAQQVLGKVISVEQGGRSIDLYSIRARIWHTVHKWVSRLKRLIWHMLKVIPGISLTFGDL